jgi:ATP-dependent DNA helicase RecG
MLRTELLDIIASGENSGVEFKRNDIRPEQLVKEIVAYQDRLDISSPVALQNAMTIEKMLAGQRSDRNPIIIKMLRDYDSVDARGMGVRRKIVPLVREASGTDPIFEATEDHVRLVLPTS